MTKLSFKSINPKKMKEMPTLKFSSFVLKKVVPHMDTSWVSASVHVVQTDEKGKEHAQVFTKQEPINDNEDLKMQITYLASSIVRELFEKAADIPVFDARNGTYRVMGYDTFSGESWEIGRFQYLDEAVSIAQKSSGEMMQTVVFDDMKKTKIKTFGTF